MGSKNKDKNKNNKVAGDSAGTGESENGNGKKVIADPRFSKIHSDPRFQKVPKHKAKVSIDSRFNRMFSDKRFATSSAPLDKRGKPKKQSENALRRYYHIEDENEETEKKRKREKEDESEGSDSESNDSKLNAESSESESESEPESEDESESDGSTTSTTDTDDEADDDDDDVEMLGDEASLEVENVPVIEKETHRLAVVNMDWNQVKSVDLFATLSSCLPKGGQIKSVAVYPSEFGLKRMEEETVRGPVALFVDEKKDGNDVDEDDDEDEIDTEKLRAYERSRLRYYYAVVECDSIATADYLYKACDGFEFERSSNVLDLRFIPDSMEFHHQPRDVAAEVPADYDGLDFQTRALQHSNVLLSWDDDDPHRVKKLNRKFNEKQLDELEWKDFLASDESESDDDENCDEDSSEKKKNKVDKYRALLQSGDGSEEEDSEGQDMEVTFNAGLEEISQKILKKKDKESESVWEAYLRKRKEKKKARKNRSKNSSDDESDESDQEPLEQPDDFFEDEPSGERGKKIGLGKKKREEKRMLDDKEAEASKAELELLLADEKGTDNNVKGYKIKQKKTKGKKGKDAPDEEKLPVVDYDDPRFSALFTNPGFALDPTDPQFKRSATYFRQVAQKQQKGREEHAEKEPLEFPRDTSNDIAKNEDKQSDGTSQKEKHELSTIIRSIKMKSQQLPGSCIHKMRRDKIEAKGSITKEKKQKLKNTLEANGSTGKEKKHKLSSLDRHTKKKAKL